jgi:hypothetical protein
MLEDDRTNGEGRCAQSRVCKTPAACASACKKRIVCADVPSADATVQRVREEECSWNMMRTDTAYAVAGKIRQNQERNGEAGSRV